MVGIRRVVFHGSDWVQTDFSTLHLNQLSAGASTEDSYTVPCLTILNLN